MKSWTLACTLVLLVVGSLRPAAPARADAMPGGIPCAFVEGQAWWARTPGAAGTDFGHVHVGACLPHGQPISGVLEINVTVQLHNNPGRFDYLNPVLKNDSQELSLAKNYSLQGLTCPAGTCIRTVRLSVDTRLLNVDGLQELRIRTYTKEPDGNVMHASVNAIIDVRNGKPVDNLDRKRYERGKGWYTGAGYCEGSVTTPIPVGPIASWSPIVQAMHHGTAEDLPVSRHSVILDPNFHNGAPGMMLVQGQGPLLPRVIDLSGLSPGTHRLVVRAECDDPRGSTNVGLLVVDLTVRP